MPYIDKNYKPNRGDRVILAILKAFSKKRKKTKPSLLRSYAEQTGKPSFRGAKGADLAELEKRFGAKKKK